MQCVMQAVIAAPTNAPTASPTTAPTNSTPFFDRDFISAQMQLVGITAANFGNTEQDGFKATVVNATKTIINCTTATTSQCTNDNVAIRGFARRVGANYSIISLNVAFYITSYTNGSNFSNLKGISDALKLESFLSNLVSQGGNLAGVTHSTLTIQPTVSDGETGTPAPAQVPEPTFCGMDNPTNQCSGNGACVGGTHCVCAQSLAQTVRFKGDRCQYECPIGANTGLPCDDRSNCLLNEDSTKAICEFCPTGYTGKACDAEQDCPFVNAKRCYGHGTCKTGYCLCAKGYADQDCGTFIAISGAGLLKGSLSFHATVLSTVLVTYLSHN